MRIRLVRPLFVLALPALALLGACGDSGLTASGFARLDTGDARAGFEFPTDIRLDGDGTSRDVSGTCTVSPNGETYDVTVDLIANTSSSPLRTMTFRGTAASGLRADATFLGTGWTSSSSCVRVDYIDEMGGLSLRATDCAVDSATGSGTVDVSLDLQGCAFRSE